MPVYRYRDAAEMPRVPPCENSRLPKRITALWRRAAEMAPLRVTAGVQRFRTIEDANRARDAETLERMRRARSE